MNRALRLVPIVIVAVAAIAFGAGVASGGNGSTVLRGHFDTFAIGLAPSFPGLIAFTCDEQRVQRPDGSATESATCHLDAGQTPPAKAEQLIGPWISDFWFFGAPGFAGGVSTADFHGVVTPSGNLNFSATYAAS